MSCKAIVCAKFLISGVQYSYELLLSAFRLKVLSKFPLRMRTVRSELEQLLCEKTQVFLSFGSMQASSLSVVEV